MQAEFQIVGEPKKILITRGDDFSDDVWRSLRILLESDELTDPYEDRNKQFFSALEFFLSKQAQLHHRVKSYKVPIELVFSDGVKELLAKIKKNSDEVNWLVSKSLKSSNSFYSGEIFGRIRSMTSDGKKLEPKEFQKRDLNKVLSLSNAANFSVPGAGKTVVTLLAYENERVRGKVDQLMVIAPLSAFESWEKEIMVWMSPSPIIGRLTDSSLSASEVLLVNYQRLTSNFNEIARWLSRGRSHLVIDEAHRMKRGANGEWGNACLKLAHLAERRDVLTGTPAPQHARDLVALFQFLWPQQAHIILPDSIKDEFQSEDSNKELAAKIKPFFVRTTKQELRLREPLRNVELSNLKPIHAEIYQAITTKMRSVVKASNAERLKIAEISRISMYLLQAATNPALLASAFDGNLQSAITWPPLEFDSDLEMKYKIENYLKYELPDKFEKLAIMVSENAALGRKTLVWSNFLGNIEILGSQVLKKFGPEVIYGAVKVMEDPSDLRSRQYALKNFRENPDCMVLIANPATLGEGVSLHEVCHDAIYLERTFNAGEFLQSIDRIHRLGLPDEIETRITFLESCGTVDEVVSQRIKTKVDNMSQILNDPGLTRMALPDEDTYEERSALEEIEDGDKKVILEMLLGES